MLLARLQNNDRSAFEEIYQIYNRKVYCFILRYVKQSCEAKELTQQLFIRLWEKRMSLSLDKPLDAQLFVIAKNLTIDGLRRRNSILNVEQKYTDGHTYIKNITEDTISYRELQRTLDTILSTLPSVRKNIFLMSRNGFTYKEIAKEFSISTKTVEAHISKTLKVLRTKLTLLLFVITALVFF